MLLCFSANWVEITLFFSYELWIPLRNFGGDESWYDNNEFENIFDNALTNDYLSISPASSIYEEYGIELVSTETFITVLFDIEGIPIEEKQNLTFFEKILFYIENGVRNGTVVAVMIIIIIGVFLIIFGVLDNWCSGSDSLKISSLSMFLVLAWYVVYILAQQ